MVQLSYGPPSFRRLALGAKLGYDGEHNWTSKRGGAGVVMVRELAKALYGDVGPLLVDLHMALDYVDRYGRDLQRFEDWCSKVGLSDRVREFIVERLIRA